MNHRLQQTILPKLLSTRVEYPFGGTTVKTRAFLALRGGYDDENNNNKHNNNVWIYSSSHVEDYIDNIMEYGTIKYQCITHRDEASKFCNIIKAPLFCHEKERKSIEAKSAILKETFSGLKHNLFKVNNHDDGNDGGNDDGNDFIAYHSPGHTEGATCYLWTMNKNNDNGKNETVLFTGDTIYGKSNTELDIAINIHPYGENKEDIINTLNLFLTLNPTYIVPGLFQGDTIVYKYDEQLLKSILFKLK